MARAAVEMVILDDLNARREPTERSAPPEEWLEVERRLAAASPRSLRLSEVFEREKDFRVVLAQMLLTFERTENAPPAMHDIDGARMAQAA
jgi:hypothetical protein